MSAVEIIEPGGVAKRYWQSLWHHRELIFYMTWRDIIVRYKQTALGVAWVWIKPFITMIIFATIFGALAKLDSLGHPYGLVVLVGMVAWNLFSQIVNEGGNSLVGNAAMITKIYFPRLVLPLVSMIVATIDFLVSCVLVVIMFIWYGIPISWNVVFLPIFLVILILQAAGLALIFANLNVKYRDFRFVVPFLLQVGLYVSPVAYISATIPERYQFLYFLNPIASTIEGFRWCFLGSDFTPQWGWVLYAFALAAGVFTLGVHFFRAAESKFADEI